MHHKRRSRRRDKRTMLPCGCCEGFRGGRNAPRPDESEVCNGKKLSRRTRPKKEKCPVNGTHEWYKEWVYGEDYRFECVTHTYYSCAWNRKPDCDFKRKYWKWRKRTATCIHCWEVKVLKSESTLYDRFDNEWNPLPPSWRGKKVIKRRQIDPVSGMTVRQ